MAKPSLSSIYNRLNGVDPYHPFSAETFSDWSVEAGDMVSVSKGSTKYSSPVGSTTLEWNGAPQVTMTSTGQQQRDSVTKAGQKKYSGGGGSGYRNTRDVNTSITQTKEMIELEAHDRKSDVESLSSRITVTAGKIESVVQKTGVNNLGQGETLYSKVTQTENSITSVVSKTGINKLGKSETLYSKITQNERKIELKVDKNGVATALSVECGNVSISGGNLVVSGYVTAAQLNSVDGKIDNLTSGRTQATILWSNNVQVSTTFHFKDYNAKWKYCGYTDNNGVSQAEIFLVAI